MTGTMAQEGTNLFPGPDPDHADCHAIGSILSRIGDKWTVFVVRLLAERTMRFNELRRAIGGISQRMLTLTLRGLEADGLVSRTAYPTIPPRVDYALTDLGRSLIVPLVGLGRWAEENRGKVEAARQDYADASGDEPAPQKTPVMPEASARRA